MTFVKVRTVACSRRQIKIIAGLKILITDTCLGINNDIGDKRKNIGAALRETSRARLFLENRKTK